MVLAIGAVSGLVDPYGQQVTYEAYQEFLLDRIAANYVSFTILDDEELESYSTTSDSASVSS